MTVKYTNLGVYFHIPLLSTDLYIIKKIFEKIYLPSLPSITGNY